MDQLTKNQLRFGYYTCIKYIKDMILITEKLLATNELVFLDFLDQLNEISVKY